MVLTTHPPTTTSYRDSNTTTKKLFYSTKAKAIIDIDKYILPSKRMYCYTKNGCKVRKESDFTIFMNILSAPNHYNLDIEEKICKSLIQALTEEELTLAANTSYAYWYITTKMNVCLEDSIRDKMAMKEARRHLLEYDGNYKNTLRSLRRAMHLRKNLHIELLRTCFDEPDGTVSKTVEIASRFQSMVSGYLFQQPWAVKEKFHHSQAVLLFELSNPAIHTHSTALNEEAQFLAQIYIIERGLAAMEFNSRDCKETIVPIMDYTKGLDDDNEVKQIGGSPIVSSPTVSIWDKHYELLHQLYPSRFDKLVCIKPPSLVNWRMLADTFIDRFMSRSSSYEHPPAVPVQPNSDDEGPREKNAVVSSLDVEQYLYDVPFHCDYDDFMATKGRR